MSPTTVLAVALSLQGAVLASAVWQRAMDGQPDESRANQTQAFVTSAIAHVEMPAANPEQMSRFYTAVFGWQFEHQEGTGWEYWSTQPSDDKPGATLGLVRPEHDDHRPVPVVYVTSIAEMERVIVARGGAVAVPKHAIPGVGWQATFFDTEQNMFSLFQFDNAAR